MGLFAGIAAIAAMIAAAAGGVFAVIARQKQQKKELEAVRLKERYDRGDIGERVVGALPAALDLDDLLRIQAAFIYVWESTYGYSLEARRGAQSVDWILLEDVWPVVRDGVKLSARAQYLEDQHQVLLSRNERGVPRTEEVLVLLAGHEMQHMGFFETGGDADYLHRRFEPGEAFARRVYARYLELKRRA